uniref:Uncharacterized protein n=1 Tax=Rangifer tarandus platyrhynchus TaxID=3082113 RepID=A0ACB0F053_RANTA|nr:unnamed protein product [Rangifer tarandus platyrhynchus]
MPDPRLLRSGSSRPLTLRLPQLPPPQLHPHPASKEPQGPGGGAPGPQYTTGHLPEESGGWEAPATQPPRTPPASGAPSPWRRPLLESVRKVSSLSSVRFSLLPPYRPSARSLATHSPCCKRYRSPGRNHTTSQLARSTRTNSPLRPQRLINTSLRQIPPPHFR